MGPVPSLTLSGSQGRSRAIRNQEDRLALSSKLTFSLALALGKRHLELHALSRDPRDLWFTEDGVWLRTVAGFMPKAQAVGTDPAPFFLPALVPEEESRDQDLRLCPVRCLRLYLDLTGGLAMGGRLLRKV